MSFVALSAGDKNKQPFFVHCFQGVCALPWKWTTYWYWTNDWQTIDLGKFKERSKYGEAPRTVYMVCCHIFTSVSKCLGKSTCLEERILLGVSNPQWFGQSLYLWLHGISWQGHMVEEVAHFFEGWKTIWEGGIGVLRTWSNGLTSFFWTPPSF